MNELDDAFDAVAAHFSILSEPTRLKIMHAICHEERSVNQIVEEVGATRTNISRHLNLMHRGGVVSRRKEGTQVFYRIVDPTMAEMCRTVCVRIGSAIENRQPLHKGVMQLAW